MGEVLFRILEREFYVGSVALCYCLDGHNDVQDAVPSAEGLMMQLAYIKEQAAKIHSIPFGVDVARADVGILSVSLGEESILCFTSTNDEYLTSLGDENAVGECLVYFGDHTVMSNKYKVPWDKAASVLREFVEVGTLSTEIRWTDAIY